MTLRRSGWVLWLLAPPLLGLSLYRPFTPSNDRAARIPTEIGTWTLQAEHPLGERGYALLGTDDACWRTYVGQDGEPVYLVAVFHDSNWKSVHPPHICLEGSNMEIVRDDYATIEMGERLQEVGELLCLSLDRKRDYLSLYLFGAESFTTPSYGGFLSHHLPRALLRASSSGFLMRVETWVGEGGEDAARQRCAAFLAEFLPAAEALLR
jgi:EpsI family protein